MIGLKLEGNVVINSAVFDKIPEGWEEAPEGVGKGWVKQGDGSFLPPAKEEEPLTQQDYAAAAQHVLDTQARAMGYDSIFTAVSYEGDPYPQFHDDAVVLKEWRSSVWVTAYSTLAKVEAGAIPQPSLEEFKAMLPEFEG